MTLLQTIKEDWKQNWGSIITTIGIIVMVGILCYNNGFMNGRIYQCASENGTLVEHISDEIYCEYNYIIPIDPYEIQPMNITGDLTWRTT